MRDARACLRRRGSRPRSSYARKPPTGAITGRVTDPSGGVLPGVTITVTGPGLDRPRTVTTTANGTFQLTGVPDGTFTLMAELAGFTRTTRRVSVERGGQVDLQAIKLELSAFSEPNLERMGLTPDDIPLDVFTSLGSRIAPLIARDPSTGQGAIEALGLMERGDDTDTPARVIILANERVAAGEARTVIGRVWHWPDQFTRGQINVIAKMFQEEPGGHAESPVVITRVGRVMLMRP